MKLPLTSTLLRLPLLATMLLAGGCNPAEEEMEAISSLTEPFASRHREAQAIAATFADEATLENISEQRSKLDRADLGAIYDYTQAILMLAVLGFVGMIFSFLLLRADRKQGYGLDKPSNLKE